MDSIGDFFARLGFVIDDNELPQFQQNIQAVQQAALEMSAVLVAASAAVGVFVGVIADGLDELGDFAEQEQVAVEMIQELGHAAQLSGSSLEAVKGSIQSMNKTLGEAALGVGRGAQSFEKLGLSARNADGSVKSIDELLANVADKMVGLSRQEQIAMAEKLGIDRGLIPLLAKGSAGIAELREEARMLGVASKADTDIAGAFADEMDRARFVMLAFGRSIAVGIMPYMTRVIEATREWFTANREVIRLGLDRVLSVLGVVLGSVVDWMVRIGSATAGAIKWLSQFKVVVWASVAALTALGLVQVGGTFNALIAFARQAVVWLAAVNVQALLLTGWVGLIVVAVAILADEIYNFTQGNESFLGDLVKEFPILMDYFNYLLRTGKAIFAYFSGLWEELKPALQDLGVALVHLFVAAQPIMRAWGRVLLWIFENAAPYIGAFLMGMITRLTSIINRITTIATIAIDLVARLVEVVAEILDFISFLINAKTEDWLNGFRTVGEAIRGVFATLAQWLLTKFDFMGGLMDKARSLLGMTPTPVVQPVAAIGSSEAAPLVPGVQRALAFRPTSSPVVDALLQAPALAARAMPGAGLPGVPGQAGADGAPAQAPRSMAFRPSGVLGRAEGGMGSTTQTTTNTTTITAPITVNNPNPADAGREVQQRLETMQRQAIRNGQSKVDL